MSWMIQPIKSFYGKKKLDYFLNDIVFKITFKTLIIYKTKN